METYFAPAERDDGDQLNNEVQRVSANPVIDGLLGSVGGLLAVLNEKRQILALNENLLATLGVADAKEVLGLRPGEVVHCVHAHETPGGCGTSMFCSTCGAAIAIVTSLSENHPVERMCALKIDKEGADSDLYLRVRSCPINFEGNRLILLFLQDITHQQQLAALEQVFFHDVNNLLGGLVGACEMLSWAKGKEIRELASGVQQAVGRLVQEMKIQQSLLDNNLGNYQRVVQTVSIQQIFDELQCLFSSHSAAKERTLCFVKMDIDFELKTDSCLLSRILGNMIINACEATQPGEEVKVRAEKEEDAVVFCVWNKAPIPDAIAKRIFQRNFSTKQDMGRGLGTYSMKLFGELALGGKVDYITSEIEGTSFRLRLPINRA